MQIGRIASLPTPAPSSRPRPHPAPAPCSEHRGCDGVHLSAPPPLPNPSSLARTGWHTALLLANDPTTCWACGGSGKCQNDYPRAGTGKTMMGGPEPQCEGSGDCYKCGGSGVLS